MSMMGLKIHAGRGICLPIPDDEHPHLFIVLTGASSYQESTVAVVNLTSLGSSRGVDTTVILTSQDHPFIRRPTVINYKDAFVAQTQAIQEAILAGEASFRESFSGELLDKIQIGAIQSAFTPQRVKDMVYEHLGFSY